jgi:hypothetical protein
LAALAILNGWWKLPPNGKGRWARASAWVLAISSIAFVGITWMAVSFRWLGGEFIFSYEVTIEWLFGFVALLVSLATLGTAMVAGAMWRGWSAAPGPAPLVLRVNAILAAMGGFILTGLALMNC